MLLFYPSLGPQFWVLGGKGHGASSRHHSIANKRCLEFFLVLMTFICKLFDVFGTFKKHKNDPGVCGFWGAERPLPGNRDNTRGALIHFH